ncbi:uncharacterized protein LY89DRAFT_164617 [Mollisia scopiformis]|uniref:Uncharacterized protein n=1 Tax=Mollisia scopiformis TaxID=149040 RepID=A0A194XTJ1_MOLSC|nr:uncharacterized protein LY89DRAFT_164617 [Mollisia scopiformis]KUJ23012.1 hypothetical protein LY89DRAFT_164617 [Mollisia scopiformis]
MSNDDFSPQGFTRDRPSGPQRGASLQISTSRQGDGRSMSQSSGLYSALPPSTPYRTSSGPLPSPSTPQHTTATRSSTLDTPRSAGYNDKSQWFSDSSKNGTKSPTSPKTKRRSDSSMIDKRISPDPKTNVYTQCGRHSDQWLFGGFPFDNIKKALERDKKE